MPLELSSQGIRPMRWTAQHREMQGARRVGLRADGASVRCNIGGDQEVSDRDEDHAVRCHILRGGA